MRIISAREVVFSAEEGDAHDAFDRLLDEGHSIPTAVETIRAQNPNLDPNFYRWIGDEPLILEPPPKIRIVIGYDSLDRSYIPNAVAYNENDQIVEADVEVRDYGRGSQMDDDGNLYLDVTE